MAAVTVEDCLKVIPNRFELSLVASYRAKQLMNGATPLYASEKIEKYTVVALREIAANLLDTDRIREELKSNIKNQSILRNFDEGSSYEAKKEDDADILLEDDLGDDMDSDLGDDNMDEDDDEYYNNMENSDIEDDLNDEDIDK